MKKQNNLAGMSREEITNNVRRIIGDYANMSESDLNKELTDSTDFADIGLDSLDHINVILNLEEWTGHEFDTSSTAMPVLPNTVDEIVNFIEKLVKQ